MWHQRDTFLWHQTATPFTVTSTWLNTAGSRDKREEEERVALTESQIHNISGQGAAAFKDEQ